MLLLALILVRQERDSGLLSLIRSLPGGRLKTAIAKLAAFAARLLVVLMVLYGVNLAYCSASFSLGPMNRTIQSVPALMRCTMQITVGQYLLRFLLAKWAGAFVMGLWVMLAALLLSYAAGYEYVDRCLGFGVASEYSAWRAGVLVFVALYTVVV